MISFRSPSARRLLAGSAAGAMSVGIALLPGSLTPTSHARALADTTVTIKAAGTDLSGTVRSPRRACKAGRLVIVYRQVGSRGGGDDVRFATDNAELRDGVGVWSTGNTGIEGLFYAKVRRTDQCRGDSSRSVRTQRN